MACREKMCIDCRVMPAMRRRTACYTCLLLRMSGELTPDQKHLKLLWETYGKRGFG